MPSVSRLSFGGSDIRVSVNGRYIVDLERINWEIKTMGNRLIPTLGSKHQRIRGSGHRIITGRGFYLLSASVNGRERDVEQLLAGIKENPVYVYKWWDEDTETQNNFGNSKVQSPVRLLDEAPFYDINIITRPEAQAAVGDSFEVYVATLRDVVVFGQKYSLDADDQAGVEFKFDCVEYVPFGALTSRTDISAQTTEVAPTFNPSTDLLGTL